MDVGELIKQSRLDKGMTQEELADKVGVQKSAVAKWENGRVSEIKRTNLMKLAAALGLEAVQLIGGAEREKSTAANDGLSKDKIELIEQIKLLPEEKIQLLLQVARSIK